VIGMDERKDEAKAVQIQVWETPRFEVISLDCEITAYTPDDRPLF
jgi:hypothetical protein